jgi:Holliday junction resolvasome RuvABC endonuclease subunit
VGVTRIISIDQSYSATGYSIWEGDKLYDFGVISSNKEDATHIRIKYIIDRLRNIIQDEDITHLVLEGLSLGGVSNSSRSLGALFYCIQILCDDLGIPFEDIPPKTVKKIWTGNGNSSKKDMEKACPEDLLKKIEASPFKTISKGRRDIIDSFAIYKSWVHLYN